MTKHKHFDCIVAWANGATIQCLSNANGADWRDIANPSWHSNYDYRVKPEPVPDRVMYTYVNPIWEYDESLVKLRAAEIGAEIGGTAIKITIKTDLNGKVTKIAEVL